MARNPERHDDNEHHDLWRVIEVQRKLIDVLKANVATCERVMASLREILTRPN